MNRTVFNKTLTLIESRSGYGSADDVIVFSKTVKASVRVPYYSLTLRAGAVGLSVDLVAELRRKDFESGKFNRAEYSGVQYRIESVNAGAKEMFVRLALTRG